MEQGAAFIGAQVLLPKLCVPNVWKQPVHVQAFLAFQASSHAHASDVSGEDIEITQKGCAASGAVPCRSDTRGTPEQAREYTSPTKIIVTSKFPVGNISVVTLIRTDTTLDHSQKAEKVCPMASSTSLHAERE